jgi:hypothetical protein
MRYIILTTGALGAIALAVLGASPTAAQVKCPEGRTASGACVNPGLADSSQRAAIVFSQPQLSHTAYPILPTGDRLYRYPNELIPYQQPPSASGPGLGCISHFPLLC